MAAEPSEVVERKDSAAREDLEALLRKGLVAVGEVMDRARRPVREAEHDGAVSPVPDVIRSCGAK